MTTGFMIRGRSLGNTNRAAVDTERLFAVNVVPNSVVIDILLISIVVDTTPKKIGGYRLRFDRRRRWQIQGLLFLVGIL